MKTSFEKAFWKLEPNLPYDTKEFSTATLPSVALIYTHRRGPESAKSLLKAIHKLKRRDDIVIIKPDLRSGVVIMDKSEYLRLLREAYINDTTKFRVSDPERPKARGYKTQTLPSTPPTEGEDLESIVRRILPKPIADSVRLTGSRLAAQDPQKTFGYVTPSHLPHKRTTMGWRFGWRRNYSRWPTTSTQ